MYIWDIGGYIGAIGMHYCSDDSWIEADITWNNKPDFSETATSKVDFYWTVFLNEYYCWNATTDVRLALGKGKLTEVLVDHRSSSYAYFNSREGSNSPKLMVEYSVEPIYEVHFESIQEAASPKTWVI